MSYDIVYASCGMKDVNMGLCKSEFVAPVEHLSRVGVHLVDLFMMFWRWVSRVLGFSVVRKVQRRLCAVDQRPILEFDFNILT